MSIYAVLKLSKLELLRLLTDYNMYPKMIVEDRGTFYVVTDGLSIPLTAFNTRQHLLYTNLHLIPACRMVTQLAHYPMNITRNL